MKLPAPLSQIPRSLLYLIGAVALLFAVVQLQRCWRSSTMATIKSALPSTAPVKAPPTRAAAAAPVKTETRPVQRLELKPKARKALEAKYGIAIASPEERAAGAPKTEGASGAGQPAFGLLPPARTVDVLTEVKLPELPHGGEAVATVDAAGKVEVSIKPKARPFFELGGRRETGLSYDVLRGAVGVYHEQDLFRTGPVVWGVRGFFSYGAASLCGAGSCQDGANHGLELRAGVRW